MAIITLHNIRNLRNVLNLNRTKLHMLRCAATSKSAEAVFINKCVEEPVISLSDGHNIDIIGPPDPVSNLRPIIRHRLFLESSLQHRLRQLQDSTQDWNQKFWMEHNTRFIRERQEYIKMHLKPGDNDKTLTADEMSEFYKYFLDKNWRRHVSYNFQWYKHNFSLLLLAVLVNFETLLKRS